jgi:hypothetical protein
MHYPEILNSAQLGKALSGQELTLNFWMLPRTQINPNSAANPPHFAAWTNARYGAAWPAGRRDVHSPGGSGTRCGGCGRRRAEEPPPRWTGEGGGGRGEHRSRTELPSADEANALGDVGGREGRRAAAALAPGHGSGGAAAGERSERRHLGLLGSAARRRGDGEGRVRCACERAGVHIMECESGGP